MIPIAKPVFDEEDLRIIQEPLMNGWVTQGKYVEEFENVFGKFIGIENSIAVTSCTTALHVIMAGLGIKPGDEVIVPSFTWIATANCVEYMGARPVFVDVNTTTFNIDVDQIERNITTNTKAIIPVHLFGLCADMDSVMEIAERHNLSVVEDAACGFDSWYKGKHAGTMGYSGAFSFHPRKSITTGEGGMVVTSDGKFAELMRSLRNHGASGSDYDRHNKEYSFLLSDYEHLGFNFRMTDIQGALGVSQMKKAADIMKRKRSFAEMYYDKLKGVEWLQLPFKDDDYIHGYQSFVCLFKPVEITGENMREVSDARNKLMHKLEQKGIMTRQGTHSVVHTKYYKDKYGVSDNDCINSLISENCSIALPLYAGMSEEDVEYICNSIREEFEKVYNSNQMTLN